jgi:6,7-dimethyl-8-ribityllumazine synthase
MKVALVVSEYHEFITSGLERGARAALSDAGLPDSSVQVFGVPGAYELAQAARRLAETGKFDAIVCLGCLIRGETPHFDYIAQAAAHGIMHAAQETGVPVAFGVLTTNTADEAIARATDGPTNKGAEAARAALAMVRVYQTIDGSGPAAGPAAPEGRPS